MLSIDYCSLKQGLIYINYESKKKKIIIYHETKKTALIKAVFKIEHYFNASYNRAYALLYNLYVFYAC